MCNEHRIETNLAVAGDIALQCPEIGTMAAMQDRNDLRLFAEVVAANGFAAAARRLGVPRSRISRRIGLLEEGLGVRLIHRSTRHFAVTEVGK